MKTLLLKLLAICALLTPVASARGLVVSGPFPLDQWPASLNKSNVVHYVSVGDLFAPPSGTWVTGNMKLLSGGDQNTTDLKIGGFDGLKVVGNYLNTADSDFATWADHEEIDILMQVYGDGALFQGNGNPRNFNFLLGTLPELNAPVGGQIPIEARNRQWNWVLFRVPNGTRGSDGSRFVGSLPANAQGATSAGGVNGGTIRLEGVPNLIVRVVAFGEKGAFGEPEQVNVFAAAGTCPPEPETNHAFMDVAKNQANHMQVANSGNQTVTFADNIGPMTGKRRAVRASNRLLNFPVTENYLGAPCSDPRAMKLCVEFYDDAALAGKTFGPETYATDDKGGQGTLLETRRYTLKGSGNWVRIAWTIPAVSLFGVNVAPLTGGPRLSFDEGGQIYLSRFDLGVFRIGTNALAGVDPIPDCFADPDWCTYGNFVEMDLAKGNLDGLAPGNSGGDQEMIQAEAGPTKDRRLAIRPARDDGSPQFSHNYLNFSITDEKLGPTSQPGVTLAICVTYYDDPTLTGAQFRPEVYISDRGGSDGFAFAPTSLAVTLEGTDTWREAYFELPELKFTGVNQGPQAAARFTANNKVFFSRVRYGVLRPCDVTGFNPLAACKPVVNPAVSFSRGAKGALTLSWPLSAADFVLEQTGTLVSPNWVGVLGTPAVGATAISVTLTPNAATFFRLRK